VPFYVAAPLSTFDLNCKTGNDIEIEQRDESEVIYQKGLDKSGEIREILVCNPGSEALNPAFDVTPAKYIKGIITEKGIIEAGRSKIEKLFQ
jgi:methylthioribose-1-phosphate isomerase